MAPPEPSFCDWVLLCLVLAVFSRQLCFPCCLLLQCLSLHPRAAEALSFWPAMSSHIAELSLAIYTAFLLRFAPDLNPPAIPGLASHDQRLLTHPGLCQAVQSLSDVDRSRRTRMRSLNSFHLLLTVQSSMSWKCRNLSLPSRKSK